MAKPHEPTPPVPPLAMPDISPSLPTVPLTREQEEILKDPLVGDDVKLKILKENREAEQEAIHKFLTSEGPGGGGGLSPYAAQILAHQSAMVHFAIEKRLWNEELASDEAFRNKLEGIVKSEKAKSESGHYKEDKKHGRGGR